MDGGLGPSGLVTLNVSVRHLVKSVTGMVPSAPTTPAFFTSFVVVAVEVLGPLMTKLTKSSLS